MLNAGISPLKKTFQIEMDGKRSVRSLTGLRRDSEVMYVGTYETHSQQIGKRGKISDVWGTLSRARSTPDLLGDRDPAGEEQEYDYNVVNGLNVDDTVLLQQPASIFNRPGFGSVAFRRSVGFLLTYLIAMRDSSSALKEFFYF